MSERTFFQNPWALCACGHFWLIHDFEGSPADGTDLCCADNCDQHGCPGKAIDDTEEPAP